MLSWDIRRRKRRSRVAGLYPRKSKPRCSSSSCSSSFNVTSLLMALSFARAQVTEQITYLADRYYKIHTPGGDGRLRHGRKMCRGRLLRNRGAAGLFDGPDTDRAVPVSPA